MVKLFRLNSRICSHEGIYFDFVSCQLCIFKLLLRILTSLIKNVRNESGLGTEYFHFLSVTDFYI